MVHFEYGCAVVVEKREEREEKEQFYRNAPYMCKGVPSEDT